MIRSCLMSRKELKDLIEKSPQTADGHYFFPRFNVLLMAPGKIKDTGFYYDRSLFKDKMCFDDEDIRMLTAKKKMKVDIEKKAYITSKLKEALEGVECLDLKDKLINQDFTLEELIDTCIYINKIKFS